MEQKLEKLSDSVDDMKSLIKTFNDTLINIENRLARLEKVDSIEHRIAVNQIDLSDIKDALERLEEVHTAEISKLLKEIAGLKGQGTAGQIDHINRRLDSHLIKLAKAEEEILLLKAK